MDYNIFSIIIIAIISLLFFITILVDIISPIKREKKSEVVENGDYFVHPDVKSILRKRDPNTGIRKEESEYVNNGTIIIDVFLNKINKVIADIK